MMNRNFDIYDDCPKCNHDYITQCTSNLELIDSKELAWDYILRLRNENASNFIQQHEITKKEHYDFMKKYGKNYFIFYRLCDGCKCGSCYCPCGFIGVVDNDIRLCTDSKYRREGVAVEMLEFVRDHFPIGFGKVKKDNIVNQKAFEKAYYNKFESDEGFIYYYVPENLRGD